MAKTNPEYRLLAEQIPDISDRVFQRLRIAGTIREKDPIRLQVQHFLSRRRRRHDCHLSATAREVTQNVRFDSIVICHDVKWSRLKFRKTRKLDEVYVLVRVVVRLLNRDRACKVQSNHLRRLLDLLL